MVFSDGVGGDPKILKNNFSYNTPKSPLNDSVIHVIMLSYWHEAAIVA
jgi:hypothetical protein